VDLQPLLEAPWRRNDSRGAVDAFFEYMCPGLWQQLDDRAREPYRANHAELMPDLQMPQYVIGGADLARMLTPCVVVSGSESHPVLRRVARALSDGLSNATFEEIQGAGHVTYAEAPDQFAAIVKTAARPAP
jgi:pimeloyl-ACP methyl ester carboxylesterase